MGKVRLSLIDLVSQSRVNMTRLLIQSQAMDVIPSGGSGTWIQWPFLGIRNHKGPFSGRAIRGASEKERDISSTSAFSGMTSALGKFHR